MNVPRMHVLGAALKNDDGAFRFDMGLELMDCGTVGDIAGLAIVMFGDPKSKDDPDDQAQELLGLTNDQKDALFFPELRDWDHPFYTRERAARAVELMIGGDNDPWVTIWKKVQP